MPLNTNQTNKQSAGSLLDKIDHIEAKTFEWLPNGHSNMKHSERRPGTCLGLVAEDIQQLHPLAVMDTDDGLGYEQTALNGVFMQLIKDLKGEIDALKKKVK